MLREHAPLIAVSTVIAILFYLVFRDLRGLRAAIALAASSGVSVSSRALLPSGLPATAQPKGVVGGVLDASDVDLDGEDGGDDDEGLDLVDPPAKPARRRA